MTWTRPAKKTSSYQSQFQLTLTTEDGDTLTTEDGDILIAEHGTKPTSSYTNPSKKSSSYTNQTRL